MERLLFLFEHSPSYLFSFVGSEYSFLFVKSQIMKTMKSKTPLIEEIILSGREPVDMQALYKEVPWFRRVLTYDELLPLLRSLWQMNYNGCDLLPVVYTYINADWYIRNVLNTQDGTSWKLLNILIRFGGVIQDDIGKLLVDRIQTECRMNIPNEGVECLVLLLEKVPSESRVLFDFVPEVLHWRTITSAKLTVLEMYHPLERETVLYDMIRMYSECLELRVFMHTVLTLVFKRPWINMNRWLTIDNGKYRELITNFVQNDENKTK